jgi:putative solute:sodium symporter small subunit
MWELDTLLNGPTPRGKAMDYQEHTSRQQRLDSYWRANARLISVLVVIWFAVAYIPPLIVQQLNQFVILGFPLGYYMGSQGALIVFVILSVYYAWRAERLDRTYGIIDDEAEYQER